jgi:excinuclease UvrABC nuclease subunit
MTARRGVMQLGPFVGRRGIEKSVRALSRMLGLRTCTGKLAPDPEFAVCVYGQMGHCAAPCNESIDTAQYGERVGKAFAFLRGRSGALLRHLALARDQAASQMRFEEAGRAARDLESLTVLANRASRLSQVVTENNLIIVTGDDGDRVAHVVLAGRLATSRALDSEAAAAEVADFVRLNFERMALKPVDRGELEAMTIVARWLRERAPDEGRLHYLSGPEFDPAIIR